MPVTHYLYSKDNKEFTRLDSARVCKSDTTWPLIWYTDEAPISGHPREAEKVPATVAGRLRECVNTEFV